MDENGTRWDVFVSYASEDLETVARPLSTLLGELGLRVWFDKFELCVGDSLRQRIDEGLAQSRFGVVILSKAFFARHWPQKELNGLYQREVEGQKVLLPVWHGVSVEYVRRQSPTLADTVGVSTEQGIPEVALKILSVVRPDVFKALSRSAASALMLPRITSGQVLGSIVGGAHAYLPLNDEPSDEFEVGLVGGFLQGVQDWGDIWNDIGADGQVRAQFAFASEIKELEEAGFGVYAVRQKRRIRIGPGDPTEWSIAAIAVLRGLERKPLLQGDRLFVESTNKSDYEDVDERNREK